MTRPSWIGQILGERYRIDDILGQGGMSAVYKAYDPNLKRVVAVKLIHTHLAEDQKFRQRFEEEAAAVAQLRHPNIVQVFDFNHDGDVYYMVQEFLAGETLQQRLSRLNKANRRMSLAEAIGFIINICDAAGYAHQRGLVHRDIKPANIMLDVHNQAILMDFGIVKIVGSEKHTVTGAVVGTALYLPPEAIRGETPDPRSDQYSLGVTLFEAVNGRPPFEADSAMTLMMMHLNDPLPNLCDLRPDTPPELAAVINRALSKNREDRYASMSAFAGALRSVLALLSTAPAATLADEPGSTPPKIQPEAPVSRSATPAPFNPPPPAASDQIYPAATPVPRPQASPATSPVQPSSSLPNYEGGGTVPPASPPAFPASIPGAQGRPSTLLLFGILAAVVVIFGLGFFFLRGSGGGAASGAPSATVASVASVPLALEASPTAAASVTLAPTQAPTREPTPAATLPPSSTPEPTATAAPASSPTPTVPAGVPYSRINGITIQDGYYSVDYETFEYTAASPGQHVHFFFNTVPPTQAGNPGYGPWKLYGGPSPFRQYCACERPKAATQLCILVSNSDHSVEQNSGNCFILPDVNVAAPLYDEPCRTGPGEAFPATATLAAGQILQVTGISPDEAWWAADYAGQACWLQRSRSDFAGDLGALPMAEVPDAPALSVQISQITLDAQGNYAVAFKPVGYTPALPGTHIHFYFDIFSADQQGATGNRLMYAGESPFTGFSQASRPNGANQICALVANPDHTVIPGSGNCAPLP